MMIRIPNTAAAIAALLAPLAADAEITLIPEYGNRPLRAALPQSSDVA